jgi:hypothetical protein
MFTYTNNTGTTIMHKDLVRFQREENIIQGYTLLGSFIGIGLFIWLPVSLATGLVILVAGIVVGGVVGQVKAGRR